MEIGESEHEPLPEDDEHEEEDSTWYYGKARDEFHRRQRGDPPGEHQEDDPIQVRS